MVQKQRANQNAPIIYNFKIIKAILMIVKIYNLTANGLKQILFGKNTFRVRRDFRR